MVVAPSIPLADSDTLVRVSGVSKKFCLSLKKSLWYGLCDMGRELTGRRRGSGKQGSEGDDRAGLRPKEFWAVNNVSFELKRGECLGLIGRNGAGKTTLLKMLNGLIKPDAGRIEMRGRIGALIALGAGFNPVLTGRENIYINASVLGLSKKEIDAKIDEIIDFAEIGDFIDTPVQNYSSGMAVRLGFAVASSLEPEILLIDEVLAVGDISFRLKCLNRIAKLLPNAGVILVSHSMEFISSLCTHVLLMDKGHPLIYGNDVLMAIEMYNQTAHMGHCQSVGGDKIHLDDIKFKLGDGSMCNSDACRISNGDPLEIELTLRSNADYSQTFVPWVHVVDSGMREVLGIFHPKRALFLQLAPHKRITLRVKVNTVQLSTGKYSLSVGFTEPTAKENLARIDHAASLWVDSESKPWTVCSVYSKWEVVDTQ